MYAAEAPASPTPAGPLPLITPNCRRIDRRRRDLSFGVRAHLRPYFEVLLTTDRSLFDPANASRRTPANFYAGRQDGGLLRSSADETAYIVPAAVLQRFAEARPRPSEIFYTVAAYDTPDGPPLLAQPPALLATTAPSVLLGADFESRAMASVLAIPADKLQSFGDVSASLPPAAAAATYDAYAADPSAATYGSLADDDLGEAATGALSWTVDDLDEQAAAHAAAAWEQVFDADSAPVDAAAAVDEWADDELAGAYGDDDGPEASGYAAYEEEDDDPPFTEQQAAADDDDYDDGLDAPDPSSALAAGGYDEPYDDASETFAAEDEDDDELGAGSASFQADDETTAAQLAYDDGYGGEPYADEASWNGAGAAAAPLADDGAENETLADQFGAELDDGAFDDLDAGPAPSHAAAATVALDIPAKIAILAKIGRKFESGKDGYGAMYADGEFSDRRFTQYQRWHVGLTYGFIQFTQDSGGLGRVLELMRDRDRAAFDRIFGPDADALVRITNLKGPSGAKLVAQGGRSVRVAPVAGYDIWDPRGPWPARFKAAGAHDPFKAAQNELAVRMFLDPNLDFAAGLGLMTERALAVVVDRAIQMGSGGARGWIIKAVGPVRTDAQRQQALAALGRSGIEDFQRSAGMQPDAAFGPLTHAALVGALRGLGARSPIPMPTRGQLLGQIAERAEAEKRYWAHRPRKLLTDPDFADAELTWPAPTAH